jgi:hypothetical protein
MKIIFRLLRPEKFEKIGGLTSLTIPEYTSLSTFRQVISRCVGVLQD